MKREGKGHISSKEPEYNHVLFCLAVKRQTGVRHVFVALHQFASTPLLTKLYLANTMLCACGFNYSQATPPCSCSKCLNSVGHPQLCPALWS